MFKPTINRLKPRTRCLCSNPLSETKNWMFVFKPTIWNQEPDVCVQTHYLKPRTKCSCTNYLKPRMGCSYSNQLSETKNWMFVFKPTIWNQEPDVCVQTDYLKPRTECSCSNQLFDTQFSLASFSVLFTLCGGIDIFTARIRSMTGRYCFHRCLSVNISGGGYLVSDFRGEGGYLVSDFRGEGGYLVSDFRGGGGYLVLVKGKIFDSRFGLIHVQTGEKKFLLRDPPPQ